MKTVFVRDVEDKKVFKVDLDENCRVRKLIDLIEGRREEERNSKSLFFKGLSLSEDRKVNDYDVQEHDLLIWDSREREDENGMGSTIGKAPKTVLSAKRWLVENIGIDEMELVLSRYGRTGEEEREVVFKTKDCGYRMLCDEDRVKDYNVI